MEYIIHQKRETYQQHSCLIKIHNHKEIIKNATQYLENEDIYVSTNGLLLLSGRRVLNIINEGSSCIENCIEEVDYCKKISDKIKGLNVDINDFLFKTNAITPFLFGEIIGTICDLRKLYASIYDHIYNSKKKSATTWFFMDSLNQLEMDSSVIYQKYYIHESK